MLGWLIWPLGIRIHKELIEGALFLVVCLPAPKQGQLHMGRVPALLLKDGVDGRQPPAVGDACRMRA